MFTDKEYLEKLYNSNLITNNGTKAAISRAIQKLEDESASGTNASCFARPEELKPCPFCGGKFDYVKENLNNGKVLFAGGCYNNCVASPRIGWFYDLQYIKEMWNKRAG